MAAAAGTGASSGRLREVGGGAGRQADEEWVRCGKGPLTVSVTATGRRGDEIGNEVENTCSTDRLRMISPSMRTVAALVATAPEGPPRNGT
jgi:hypothetical protein